MLHCNCLKLNHKKHYFIVIFLFLISFYSSYAANSAQLLYINHVTFSIELLNQTLQSVVKELSIISGYRIELHTDLKSEQISAKLENVILPEAIGRILRDFNHFEVWDDENKKLILFVFKGKKPPASISGKERIFEQTSKTIITTP